jgi:ketosteroid isomerase-like protein
MQSADASRRDPTPPIPIVPMRLPSRSSLAALLAAATCAACASVPARPVEAPLVTLVEAERAFAATAAAEGAREAFLRHAAEDAVIFAPEPVNALDHWRPRPPGRGSTLAWYPSIARASLSGDLGFTTGPYETRSATGGEPTGHGWYVTVWRNEGRGWRFVADLGTPNPAPDSPPPPWTDPPSIIHLPNPAGAHRDRRALGALRAADLAFAQAAAERGFGAALSEWAVDEVRLHRPRTPPAEGKVAASALAGTDARRYSAEPREAHVARAGDLGYAVGEYRLADESGNGRHESGWYLRIWMRDGGAWRVLLDVVSPHPAEREE